MRNQQAAARRSGVIQSHDAKAVRVLGFKDWHGIGVSVSFLRAMLYFPDVFLASFHSGLLRLA